MAIDTRYDTCAACAADEQCAIVANVPICGDCGKEIAIAAASAYEDELDNARAEVKSAEEDRDEAQESMRAAEQRADDADTALRAQEAVSADLAAKIDTIRAMCEGVAVPVAPKKPRKAKAATVAP